MIKIVTDSTAYPTKEEIEKYDLTIVPLYVSSNKGSAALEALTQLLFKFTGFSLTFIRIGLDALMVIVGVLLGAPIGIGTLLCVLAIGPIFGLTLKQLNRV